MNDHQIVEAVLFASDAPLTADEIARADESLDEDRVEQALQLLQAEYDDAGRAFEINELAEGYQILTRPEFAPYLERFDTVPRPSRLSGPALETLAIISYRQPLGRVEVEYIRGVGSSGVIKTLVDRQLIEVVGRGEGLGRPLLYGTTTFFLEHFGFKSLEDLPRPEDLPVVLRDRAPLDLDDGDDEEEGEGEAEPDAEAGEAQGEMALPPGAESEAGGADGEEGDGGDDPGEGGEASGEGEAVTGSDPDPRPAPGEGAEAGVPRDAEGRRETVDEVVEEREDGDDEALPRG